MQLGNQQVAYFFVIPIYSSPFAKGNAVFLTEFYFCWSSILLGAAIGMTINRVITHRTLQKIKNTWIFKHIS
ncbi:MAG: hypothetical protein ACTSUV_01640 [Candidatus Ranarchaeia archaeon]